MVLLASTAAGQKPGTAVYRPPNLTATFIGNEAWHVTDGEYVLLTDFPYQGGYAGYMTWDWARVPKAEGPKVLLVITHQHRDHFASDELARLDPGGVIGPALIRAAAGSCTEAPRRSPSHEVFHRLAPAMPAAA